MELRHRRYFVAVAEELHFGRAAARLGISQPALSKQILELEAQLRTTLLWRNRREVRLTPAGLSFLKHSRDVIHQIDRSIRDVQSVGRGDLGSVEVSYFSSAAPRVVPTIVRSFKKQYPKVDVRLRLTMPPNHLGEIRNNQVDFLLMPLPVEANDLVVERLVEEALVLGIPQGHPLAVYSRVSIKQLDGVPMVMWPRYHSPASYDRVLGYFGKAGAKLNMVLETFPLSSVICTVAAGVAVCLVPESARDNPQKGVVYRTLRSPRPTFDWGIVYRPREIGGALEAFLQVVRTTYGKATSEVDRQSRPR